MTEAHPAILDRELAKAHVRQYSKRLYDLLIEYVNDGTQVLARCSRASPIVSKTDTDIHSAAFALYHHIITMTDGIAELVRECCGVPVVPILRSLFEASMSLDYVLQANATYEERSLAWMVGHAHNRLQLYERIDPATPRGREFKAQWEKDPTLRLGQCPQDPEAAKERDRIHRLLAKPHLAPIDAKYRALKTRVWYAINGGPKSLDELAKRLNRAPEYELFYRMWSATAHAEDLIPFIRGSRVDDQIVGHVRHPDTIYAVARYAPMFMLNAKLRMLAMYRSGESIQGWYRREIKGLQHELFGTGFMPS
jgi:hypothetical protein